MQYKCILVYSNDQILATIPISTTSNERKLLELKLIKTIFLFLYNMLKRLGMLSIYSTFSLTSHEILVDLRKKKTIIFYTLKL
jgi:hypothetical protein